MLLQIENVSQHYQHPDKKVLDLISLIVYPDEFVCIVAKPGYGKTTLFKTIAGLLPPTNGTVIINNANLFTLNNQQISNFRNQNLGIISDDAALLPNLTAFENIQLPFSLTYRGNQHSSPLVKDLMQKAKISHLQHAYPESLSVTEKCKVAILRALVCSPKIIIADDPTAGLDDAGVIEIMNLFNDIYQQGTPIVIVTSDNRAARLSHKVLLMQSGKLL